jgi:hypothetical protein
MTIFAPRRITPGNSPRSTMPYRCAFEQPRIALASATLYVCRFVVGQPLPFGSLAIEGSPFRSATLQFGGMNRSMLLIGRLHDASCKRPIYTGRREVWTKCLIVSGRASIGNAGTGTSANETNFDEENTAEPNSFVSFVSFAGIV